MTKAELENKKLSELHTLASEAGVEKFRMLSKGELVERLADGDGGGDSGGGGRQRSGGGRARSGEREGSGGGDRPRRRRRRRSGPREDGGPDEDPSEREVEGETPRESAGDGKRTASQDERGRGRDRPDRPEKASERAPQFAASEPPPEPTTAAAAEPSTGESARPRRRRRRRFGRRGRGEVTLPGLLLPPESGRQSLLVAEGREACTALLRSVAAEIAEAKDGPDPVALLIDPTPEELADWRREAPKAEIVAAGQPRHADDALAQAASRASGGEDVILLVDSLTRLAEAYGDADAAKQFFDAGRAQAAGGGGSLTVVAALERS